jgi:hypothetical protein
LAESTNYPSADELAKRLGTTVREFHKSVKPQMKRDFAKESKRIGSTNPDIGVDAAGNIVLRNPKTGAEISTDVPLSSYANE